MQQFEIRSYAKKELALLYFPTAATPHAAVTHLMSWIRRCSPLAAELEKLGSHKTAKWFIAREVRLIIHYLGEP